MSKTSWGFMAWNLGFRGQDWGLRFRIVLRFRIKFLRFRSKVLGGFRVWDWGFKV